jgi:hypothetical protein
MPRGPCKVVQDTEPITCFGDFEIYKRVTENIWWGGLGRDDHDAMKLQERNLPAHKNSNNAHFP